MAAGSAEPFILNRHGDNGAAARASDVDGPLPTATGSGSGYLVDGGAAAFLVPQFGERDGQAPRVHSLEEPTPAVTSHGAGAVVQAAADPILIQTDQRGGGEGNAYIRSADQPTFTMVTKQNQAMAEAVIRAVTNSDALMAAARQGRLVICDGVPHIVDVRFRMLDVPELAAAMGFTDEETTYEFVGTKTDQTKQIGNAVSVRTMQALVTAMFSA